MTHTHTETMYWDGGECEVLFEVEWDTQDRPVGGTPDSIAYVSDRTCDLNILGAWIGDLWIDHNQVLAAFPELSDLSEAAERVIENGAREPDRPAPRISALAAE